MTMKNQDMVRLLADNATYFKVRTAASELSEKLKRRVTVKEFLTVAADRLLEEKNKEAIFESLVKNNSNRR